MINVPVSFLWRGTCQKTLREDIIEEMTVTEVQKLKQQEKSVKTVIWRETYQKTLKEDIIKEMTLTEMQKIEAAREVSEDSDFEFILDVIPRKQSFGNLDRVTTYDRKKRQICRYCTYAVADIGIEPTVVFYKSLSIPCQPSHGC